MPFLSGRLPHPGDHFLYQQFRTRQHRQPRLFGERFSQMRQRGLRQHDAIDAWRQLRRSLAHEPIVQVPQGAPRPPGASGPAMQAPLKQM